MKRMFDEDEIIKLIESKAGKTYRHDIAITSKDGAATYFEMYFQLYSSKSTAYTSGLEIWNTIGEEVTFAISGSYDDGVIDSMWPKTTGDVKKFAVSPLIVADDKVTYDYSIEIALTDIALTDTVSEV